MLTDTLQRFFQLNVRISRGQSDLVRRLVPQEGGLTDFLVRVVPALLRPGLRVLDVGGGRWPTIDPQQVRRLGLHVVGLDISRDELARAPAGAYAQTIVGDVSSVAIPGRFDLVVSKAVLEHVADNRAALARLAQCLAGGGVMAHFVPCRHAPFALVNRLLGNRLARGLLLAIYPWRRTLAGFQAHYDLCVPSRLARYCRQLGLEIVELRPYYVSEYFEFLSPLHSLDLGRQLLMQGLRVADLAETFVLVARRRGSCRLSVVS